MALSHANALHTAGCNNFLAYPGSDTKGTVYVFDTINLVCRAEKSD